MRSVSLLVVGHLHYPDIQHLSIDSLMGLALGPAVFGAMLFDLPFAFATDLEPRAVDQQMQELCPTLHRNSGGQGALPPDDDAETGCRQSSPDSFNRLHTKPCVCRKASLNKTFSVSAV
nr:hypothetical protein [Laribacter hongkongensis]